MAAPCSKRLTVVIAMSLEAMWTWCLLHILIGVACSHYDDFGGFLMCRKCGYEIAHAKDLISVPSKLALRQRNDTIANSKHVLIQLFRNPHDMYFEVITCSEAEVERVTEQTSVDSWFPGYAWSIAKCPRCGAHLGWSFDAVAQAADAVASPVLSFVGLIMDKVMHENDVSNLIAMPKTYAS